MSSRSTAGFTVLEILVAIMVLGVGIVALAGTSGMVTRQIGRGRMITIASQVAAERFDILRRAAAIRNASGQPCQHSSFASGSGSARGITEAWTVSAGAVGVPRTVSDSVAYPRAGGKSWFTMTTIIGCK